MSSGMKIAVCGKGGVGKTTVAAVWAQLFSQEGFNVLAIDADSNPSLARAFGLAPEQSPQPLIDMTDLILERTGAEKGSVGRYFKLNPQVADLPDRYSLAIQGVKLLVLGGIDQVGSGCACPEGAFLKALMTHVLLQSRDMILVDLEAGLEFLGRASVKGVDVLVVVVEPGSRSIDVALKVARMAEDMDVKYVAAIANKLATPEQLATIKARLGSIPVLGGFKYDPALAQTDLDGAAVYQANPELVAELAKAKKELINFCSGDSQGS